MYLIRAEANYEKGGSVQATLDDINILRERAGIPEWTMENIATAESGNPKDVHKIIEEERMLELQERYLNNDIACYIGEDTPF